MATPWAVPEEQQVTVNTLSLSSQTIPKITRTIRGHSYRAGSLRIKKIVSFGTIFP